MFHMDSSDVLRKLSASESSKRTYRPGNCARMALRCLCRASHFKSAPSCWTRSASWSLGKSCARGSGPKIPLLILTKRSIRQLPKSESHWETRPTIPGLLRLSLAAAIVSSAQWTSQVHRQSHRVLQRAWFERLTARRNWLVAQRCLILLSGIGIWRFSRNRAERRCPQLK